jgi:hypothetical protein
MAPSSGNPSLLLGRDFFEMFARARSAMISGISPERRAIIDHDPIRRALLGDDDIHAADDAAVVVEEIDIRPSEMLGNQDDALVGPQDEVDDFGIGDRDPSKRTLAMDVVEIPWVSAIVCFGGRSIVSGSAKPCRVAKTKSIKTIVE